MVHITYDLFWQLSVFESCITKILIYNVLLYKKAIVYKIDLIVATAIFLLSAFFLLVLACISPFLLL